jgi:hypothetical protein
VKTVDGKQMLVLTEIPTDMLRAVEATNPTALTDYVNGVRSFFTVGPDDKVYEGVYTPPSVATSPTPLLNRTALNAFLQALSLCQLDRNYINENCPN